MAKAKGTTVLGVVRFLRRHREQAKQLLPPDFHAYLEERVLESRWYPEEHLLVLVDAMVSLMPGSRERNLEALGATAAREHLEGIYSHLSGEGKAMVPSATRAFALWSSQHDTGRFEVKPIKAGEVEMIIRDFAHPSAQMCSIFTGYCAELIRFEGARHVVATKYGCVREGAPHCTWRVSYDAGGHG
jgi:hypothetical protein